MTIRQQDITGLVLAGGRGSRMGDVDKGLQQHLGQPLALHALRRLAPQVARTMISANRHLDAYQAMGVPVWPDALMLSDYRGPLAGMLTGLQHCETPYLVTVPCDAPGFPVDLVQRLATALTTASADIAIASTSQQLGVRTHPVFCLMRSNLADDLANYLAAGQRKVEAWTARHNRVDVPFADDHAFFNANTLAELAQLQADDQQTGD
jgi:molybdopterin-guanine dinucleotide biosynthesis protein A